MSLWGPAVEAEIEYRQAEVKKAWGRQGTSGADRGDRAERRADRAEQIREGIAGMRPAATTTRRGLFA